MNGRDFSKHDFTYFPLKDSGFSQLPFLIGTETVFFVGQFGTEIGRGLDVGFDAGVETGFMIRTT
jgi:hypothetical protein